MNITFNCERCDQEYSADESYFNKNFHCDKCGHSFLILPVKDESKLNMETLLKRIIQAIGIVTFGYVAAKAIKAVGALLLIAVAVLIALWMITHTIVKCHDNDLKAETGKVQAQMLDKQADREQELKLNQIQFDAKLGIKMDIDKAIQSATTKKELLEIQLKATKEDLENEVKYIQQKLERLREIEKKHLAELPNQIINIQLTSRTIENVYWVRNDPIGVIYRTANGCGGGVISYSELSPSAIRLLGLIDDVDSMASAEQSIKEERERRLEADRQTQYSQIAYQQAVANPNIAPCYLPQPAQVYANNNYNWGNRYGWGGNTFRHSVPVMNQTVYGAAMAQRYGVRRR